MKNRVEATAHFLARTAYSAREPSAGSPAEEAFSQLTWPQFVPAARALVKLIETLPPESLPLPANQKEYLREMAVVLKSKLPDNFGFIVMAVPLGEHVGKDRVTYISTLERPSAIAAVKEWLLKCGAAEDWLKHLK